ncbi:MAG: alpha/beta hydrolase [Xanthomonadales bacterium]|nr:alpha/beta hydrolase [Xanthomonadales bacterium]
MSGSRLNRAARHVSKALAYGLVGALVVLVAVGVFVLNSRPDLHAWHEAELNAEFSRGSDVDSFPGYLELEERVFAELDREVYDVVGGDDARSINRYHRGSLADPQRWPVNWNRSFEWTADAAPFGALLLHGLSDSPYSLRSVGEALHGAGGWVVGLRLPGHGTAPSGLLKVKWEDWSAAVRLAMSHLAEQVPGRPLYIIGYSNGGALATQYALSALEDPQLPMPAGLVLLSPEIGISRLAALAAWQERLGHLIGLEKLSWNVLLPEYDPWKYGSFALNAAKQAYRVTLAVQRHIDRLEASGDLDRMPRIIAFQSVVDATVTAPALVDHLLGRLPPRAADPGDPAPRPHELVLFDLNRYSPVVTLMSDDPSAWIEPLKADTGLPFRITLLTNDDVAGREVAALSRSPGEAAVERCELGLRWPDNVFSLSHVALAFPPDDPIYGRERPRDAGWIFLGDLDLRGENGVLSVPPAAQLRLRWNPFHDYMMNRILSATLAPGANPSDCPPAERRPAG